MRQLALVLVSFVVVSCTTYKEFDPNTGRQTIAFKTSGNIGFTTSKVSSSTSQGGIPIIGSYGNNISTVAVENQAGQQAGIKVGQLAITGTMDHGTPLDYTGQWIWRTIRSVITGQVFLKGLDVVKETTLSDNASAVETSRINANAATSQAQIAADVENTANILKTQEALAP